MKVVLNLVERSFILYHSLQKHTYSGQLQIIQKDLLRRSMLITTLALILKLQNVILDIVQHQLQNKTMMMIQRQLLMVQYLIRLQPLKLVQPLIWLQTRELS